MITPTSTSTARTWLIGASDPDWRAPVGLDVSVASSAPPAVTTWTFVTVVWAPPGSVDTYVDVFVEGVGGGCDVSNVVPK